MKDHSNVGQMGIESIRLAGRRIEDLPIAEGARAKLELPVSIETERKNRIEDICRRYPKHRLDYLLARIRECRGNIEKVSNTRDEQNQMIGEYRGHISMCKHRDEEMARIKADDGIGYEAKQELIKSIKRRFPPYDVAAMEQQIAQCKEAILRCEKVIATEHASINELQVLVSRVKERDVELGKLAAKAEGS